MLWDEKLETGVKLIDDQHRELCNLVDRILAPNHKEFIDDTMKFLGEYVARHFEDEEALQAASQYVELPGHRALHEHFVKVFIDLKGQLDSAEEEDRELVIMTINGTVVDWLRNHIMVHDRTFAEYYTAHSQINKWN